MAAVDIERLHYYPGQYLGAADFDAQQEYHRDMRRRHNVGPHTWGIVVGLELSEQPSPGVPGAVDVFILPGMAVDGFGREIIVARPVPMDPALFSAFANAQYREVWLSYSEELSQQPAVGYEQCKTDVHFGRVHETYRVIVEPRQPTHDPVVVDGKPVGPPPPANPGDPTIPPDESIPYQELPGDVPPPRWLIKMGSVNWDGVNRVFLASDPIRQSDGRHYAGLVAATLYAAQADLALRPRWTPPDAASDTFTASLYGGKLTFRDLAGKDQGIPLWIGRRKGDGAPGNTDLRIHIGDGKIGDPGTETMRLTIGPKGQDGTSEAPVLVVQADDTVDIPTGALGFGRKTRQMLNLWQTQYGIGVQAGTLYFRSDSDFCWFQGGAHRDGASDPGAGGALQLKLDRNGLLTVNNNLSVVKRLSTGGDVLVGAGGDAAVQTRHVKGKDYQSDSLDNLYLNWATGKDVVIGQIGGTASSLYVSGDIYAGPSRQKLPVNQPPVDVVVGSQNINIHNTGSVRSGTFSFQVTSRLPKVSGAQFCVALSEIGNVNVATDALWVIRANGSTRISDNTFQFDVFYSVGDSDGYMDTFSYVVVFIA